MVGRGEEIEIPPVIYAISNILKRVAASNDAKKVPIKIYLKDTFIGINCSPWCYVVAYVYLDPFTQMQPSNPINSKNVNCLLISSVMVAAKFMDDGADYAKVGRISTRALNELEIELLFRLNFHLNVTTTTFNTYFSYIKREMTMEFPPILAKPPLNFGRALKRNENYYEGKPTHEALLMRRLPV